MRLAVVIPALDESEAVGAAVASALAGAPPEGAAFVLVVDGGSRDATRERARAAGARVITSPPGRARQLQAGVDACEAEVILFLHADTRLPAGYVAAMCAALEQEGVVGGAFRLRFAAPGAALRIVEWGVRLRLALFRLPYGDQAIFVRRRTLAEIGGVPQVEIMEDVDLVQALKRRGRLALLPQPVRTSARRYLERGVLRTVFKNACALLGRALGVSRARIAGWVRS